ncbi:hypothetical protein B0A55_05125 [Friedmanniomyces simplex]|uniref:Xylanolytic transcriptional activator regulatory domain-containing protein n=1 Tax=Friedmanniomyces simplex TaxID=329884 RepID=A0A4U0X780_9PEZI|nr:hypothetical protein B0A55_05125 [Friedmanniomyces simplex]
MPVIELADFDVAVMGDGSSLVVLQAVMLAGAIMRPEICSKVTVKQYYQRLKALIQSGYEQNPLNTLSALCLIQWYTPAAPKDVSTDSPRFWNTYAIGLAHQLGLHRLSKQANDTSIRRRIYFTLCARDCLTSAAHGRPKLLHPADCDLPPVALDDFSASDEDPARLFIAYSEVTSILGDLCQIVTRNGRITNHEHVAIVRRLQELLHGLPPHLSLLGATGSAKSYKLNTSQLHVAILTALVVLYRPRSVFTLSESASPSITAAFLTFRLFQAIQLRADTKYLGSAFAWYLLVAAIPLLSSAGVPGIANEATFALDGLESSLATLGEVRPAAANNFKSVRAIRHAVANATRPSRAGPDTRTRAADEAGMASIFAHYGQEASQLLKDMTSILHSSSDRQDYIASDTTQPQQAVESVMTAAMEPRSQPSVSNGFESQSTSGSDGLHNAISALFNDETLIDANSWMLRDWMDLMPPTVEE